MAVSDWSETASSNTLIDGIAIGENAARANMNDAIRAVMANVKKRFKGVPVTPRDFGAQGGGVDDTTSVQAWLNALGTGVQGFLDIEYTISSQVTITGKSNFAILGSGTLKVKNGVPAATGYAGLYISQCTDFVVQGITVNGNRANRTPAETPSHNVYIQECQRFTFLNVRSVNAVCDGYLLFSSTPGTASTHCSDFAFINCTADNSYRNGISVIEGHRGVFLGGTYRSSNGVAPQAGMDLESDPTASTGAISDITLVDVDFTSNTGKGFKVVGVCSPEDVHLYGCHFKDNTNGAIEWGSTSGSITSATVDGFTNSATRAAIDVPTGVGGNVYIRGTTFKNCTATSGNNYLFYVHSSSAGNVTIDGVNVIGTCGAIANLQGAFCRISGVVATPSGFAANGTIYVTGADAVVDGNTLTSAYGTAIYTDTGSTRAIVRNNRIFEPSNNSSGGVIHAVVAGARIEGNLVRRAASAAGYGIVTDTSADFVTNNNVSGFTGNPYVFTGAPLLKRGNIANGAVVSETAIVP